VTSKPDNPPDASPRRAQRADRQFYARVFTLAALALLGYLLFSTLRPLFAPIAWALFIAFLVQSPQAWLASHTGGRRQLSAAILTAATIFLIVGPLTALIAAFTGQAADLLRFIQTFAIEHRPSEPYDLATIPVLGPAALWIQEQTGITLPQMQTWLLDGTKSVLGVLGSLGGGAVLGALGSAVTFVLMSFILFFAIRDGKEWAETARHLLPLASADRSRLFAHLASVTRAMVFGAGVTALIQGAMIAGGFAIAGLPSPIVFGVLATLFAIVPLAGTPVIWVPAVLVLAFQDRWSAAAFLLLWGLVVATIDNVIRPILVSGRAEVGSLTVFLGVIGGVSAFGAIGVLVGPLVIALASAVLRFTLELRRPEGKAGEGSGPG